MGSIGQKSNWRFLWIFFIAAFVGVSAYVIFPLSNSTDLETSVSNDQHNQPTMNTDPSNNQNKIGDGTQVNTQSELDQKDLSDQNIDEKNELDSKNSNQNIADKNDLHKIKNEEENSLKTTKNDQKKLNNGFNANEAKSNETQTLDSKKDLSKVGKEEHTYTTKTTQEDQKKSTNEFDTDEVKNKEGEKLDVDQKIDGKTDLPSDKTTRNNNSFKTEEKEQFKNQNSANVEMNTEKLENEKFNKLDILGASEFPYTDAKQMEIDLRNLSKVKTVTFGVEARVGYSFSDVLTHKDQVTYENIGMLRNINTVEAGINGILNYKSFLFKTGIGYQKNYSTTNYKDVFYRYTRTVTYEVLLDSNNNPYNSPLFTFADTTEVSNSYQLLISTSYFTLPLQFGYQFQLKNRWNLEVMAGARFGFLMNVDSKYRSPQSMDYIQSIDHGSFQKFRIDATFDLGVNYKLTENWSIGLQLPFSIALNSIIKDSGILNYRIGGLLNLRYNF